MDINVLDGLVIEVEGGEPIQLDLNGPASADLPIMPANNSATASSTNVAPTWQDEVDGIFSVAAPEAKKPSTSRAITSHRLL
ncbi:hypothetical protein ElyMa_006489300 [Elysia marginata]|uniref:Uncharacterized protein n=1 Tax=Elysia marginata TaxID=1093978 RepID=A0AAV4I5B6_9GAST|nr:hypothetical protein ElyMa_006489300 [Elysia marginata]